MYAKPDKVLQYNNILARIICIDLELLIVCSTTNVKRLVLVNKIKLISELYKSSL